MQGEYVRQIAVCGDDSVRRSGCKRMQDLALNMSCRLLSYISCAASSRTCQHVAVHRTAKYAVQEPTCF